MCHRRGRSRCGALMAMCALLASFGGVVSADDIVPPPWRGTGLYTFQEWEFSKPGVLEADGEKPTINPNGAPKVTPGSDVDWTSSFLTGGDGYIGTGGPESFLVFDIPNFVDFEPYKLIRVQINGVWDITAPPRVGQILAFDNVVGSNVQVGFGGSDETFPGYHRWEDWQIFPNPDWEQIFINLPQGSFVNQVVIDTTSVPEPGTLSLMGLGGLGCGLAFLRRRRKQATV